MEGQADLLWIGDAGRLFGGGGAGLLCGQRSLSADPGFSGIALIVNRLWGLPIGATTVLLNIPLAFLCYKLLGRGFFLRSMRCMVISSIFIDYIGPMLPAYDGDRLLAALCTGVTMGWDMR